MTAEEGWITMWEEEAKILKSSNCIQLNEYLFDFINSDILKIIPISMILFSSTHSSKHTNEAKMAIKRSAITLNLHCKQHNTRP